MKLNSLLSLLCKGSVVLVSSAAALALSGCAMGTMDLSGPAPTTNVTFTGSVHGGEQPVTGSVIQLWEVGTSSYGSTATGLISTVNQAIPGKALTDGSGSFNIGGTFSCSPTNALVYITATGGNPGLTVGTNNSAIELVAALGPCNALNSGTTIVINEVTTAAAAYALGQYFTTTFGATSTDSFGSPSTSQAKVGITNAFATANILASTSTGVANTSLPQTGATYTITAVPEATKIYTIANMLAACVDTTSGSSTNCQTLFADVTPTSGTQVTDTLQAAVEMSLNPTSTNSNGSANNITALFGLSQGTGAPFTGLTAAPTDWTVGIQYQDSTAQFFFDPQNLAIDGLGNVYVLSQKSGLGSLVEISNSGVPEADVSTLNEYGPFQSPVANPPVLSSPKNTTTTFTTQNTVFTTTFGQATNNPAMTPRNLAIDPSNNVWFTQSSGVSSTTGSAAPMGTPASGNVFEVVTSSGIPTGTTFGFATGKSAYGLAINGGGDVFISEESTSSTLQLFEFPFNATPGNGMLTPVGYPIYSSTAGTAGTAGTPTYEPEYMAFDTNGNLWMTGGTQSTGPVAVELTNINTSSCSFTQNSLCVVSTSVSANTYNTYTLNGGGTTDDPFGLAAGPTSMYVASEGSPIGISNISTASPTSNTLVGTTATVTLPHYLAVDGAANVWISNNNSTPAGTNPVAGGSVSELSSTGTFLSPSSSSITTVNPGYVHSGLNFGLGIGVDPSGNVWVGNNSGTAPTSIFEIVGAAAPTVTPIAGALAVSKVGQKP